MGAKPRDRDAHAPRASGTLAAHYAPRTALKRVESRELGRELARGHASAVLAFGEPEEGAQFEVWIEAPADPRHYGHDLYANLRALDASGADRILVESPPREPAWEAVNDRLDRAAAGSGAFDDEP
jgi:L-threonylcarbamoyladenylate synthase